MHSVLHASAVSINKALEHSRDLFSTISIKGVLNTGASPVSNQSTSRKCKRVTATHMLLIKHFMKFTVTHNDLDYAEHQWTSSM